MLKQNICLAGILGLLVATTLWGVTVAQEEGDHDKHQDHQQKKEIEWFDMDHCEICKNMSSMKHMMHKIKWETHLLDNGMVSLTIVPEDMKEGMAKAEAGVQQTVAKLEQGQQLDMCGYCMNYGKLMSQGAKFKQIRSLGVDLNIVTSEDPEVVKEIHAMAKKSKVEHEKMLKKIKAEGSAKKEE